MHTEMTTHTNSTKFDPDEPIDWQRLLTPIWKHWRPILGSGFFIGALSVATSFLVTPMYESTTTILPPQQQQSSAASALASPGALAGLSSGGLVKIPADQYVSLMESVTTRDRIVSQFNLMARYDSKFREQARRKLGQRSLISVGKKDGLISISVSDADPVIAAEIANQYVEELRRLTTTLAVSEAQQRRVFFEKQMVEAKNRLTIAQRALQGSGINAGAIKAEPRAAADEYGSLRAQVIASEVKLATLKSTLAPTAVDVQRETATLQALRNRLKQLENREQDKNDNAKESDYVEKYREFKYEETLFELMAKQYEIARVDESRDGALIQVLDKAMPAEHKSSPRRSYYGAGGLLGGMLLATAAIILRDRKIRRP